MKKFDLEDLRKMSTRSILFKAVKEELKGRGHWKGKNRGSDIQNVLVNAVDTNIARDDEFTNGL